MNTEINQINQVNNSQMESNMFDYIKDNHSRSMLINAYNAAKKLEMLDFFKQENPPDNTGYMFWSDPRLGKFGNELESDGHSGSSFAWVCRSLQFFMRDPEGHKNAFMKP